MEGGRPEGTLTNCRGAQHCQPPGRAGGREAIDVITCLLPPCSPLPAYASHWPQPFRNQSSREFGNNPGARSRAEKGRGGCGGAGITSTNQVLVSPCFNKQANEREKRKLTDYPHTYYIILHDTKAVNSTEANFYKVQ